MDAIKYSVPVISLNNLIKWNDEILSFKTRGPNSSYGATTLGLQPKNLNEFEFDQNNSKKI